MPSTACPPSPGRDLKMTRAQATTEGASLPGGQSEVTVSLQGSLSTLGLPEVLGLLVGTAQSGELSVAGNRTAGLARMPAVQGHLWFDAGRLASADVAGEADLVDALVELLRVVEGTFTFRAGPALSSRAATEVAEVFEAAQARLAEWRAIEQVIPSQTAWLELNPDPPSGHITLRADQWRLLVALGGGTSVRATVTALGRGALAGCRAVKEMVDAGLVTVHPDDGRAGRRVRAISVGARLSSHPVAVRPRRAGNSPASLSGVRRWARYRPGTAPRAPA